MKHTYITLLMGLLMVAVPGYAQETQCISAEDLVLEVTDSSTGEKILLSSDETSPEVAAVPAQGSSPADKAQVSLASFDGQDSSLKQITDNRIVLLHVGGKWQCSGAMVGPYAVLTASHCVVNSNDGKPVPSNSITAYAGGKSSNLIARGDRIFYSKLITKVHDFPYAPSIVANEDVALIILDKPLGKQTGYFGVKTPDATVPGTRVNVKGFPGSKSNNRPWLSQGIVTNKGIPGIPGILSGDLLDFGCVRFSIAFHHTAFTEGGSSGGPVFFTRNPNQIVAVSSGYDFLLSLASKGLLEKLVTRYRYTRPHRAQTPVSAPVVRRLSLEMRKHK